MDGSRKFPDLDVAGQPATQTCFDYDTAFSRNLGWVTEAEQQVIRNKKVAIAGMGGVGGIHAVTLARLGVGHFHMADLDVFELANMNRQAGAFMTTLDAPKTATMVNQVHDINPNARVSVFDNGITHDNIDAFLQDVNFVIDGLDFFEIDARRLLFARARERGIPAITAAPLGTGSAYILFTPESMSFERYFRFEGHTGDAAYARFLVGLAPHSLHRWSLVEPWRIDLTNLRGPSTAMGCHMASAVVGAEALKVFLGRGRIQTAPIAHQIDPYAGKTRKAKLRLGNAGPVQRFKIAALLKSVRTPSTPDPDGADLRYTEAKHWPVMRILDKARWAPSGDNEQPWRFEIVDAETFRIHVRQPSSTNPYEFDNGRPIWLAVGGLLETIDQAASLEGRRMDSWVMNRDLDIIDVKVPVDTTVSVEPLAHVITTRQVDRWPYRSVRLSAGAKRRLERAAGSLFEITWRETASDRWQATRLNVMATWVRLTHPEFYNVHKRILRFSERKAPEGLPAGSIGLDPLTVKMMSWVNRAWWRTALVNRWLCGARMANLQLDVLPGMLCGAHFSLRWRRASKGPSRYDWLQAGQALQRFWLQASVEGLSIQPSFAPLMLAHHTRSRADLPSGRRGRHYARRVAVQLPTVYGDPDSIAFLGRIGIPRYPVQRARSIRKPLDDLLILDEDIPQENDSRSSSGTAT